MCRSFKQIKETMIKCDECPRCRDDYPGQLDRDGYHFHVCSMSGNMVYTTPHKIKKVSGEGYINCEISTCGLYQTIEEVLARMTKQEIMEWKNSQNDQQRSD